VTYHVEALHIIAGLVIGVLVFLLARALVAAFFLLRPPCAPLLKRTDGISM
jgi:hypothetical protein